jgi:hypothetical protein
LSARSQALRSASLARTSHTAPATANPKIGSDAGFHRCVCKAYVGAGPRSSPKHFRAILFPDDAMLSRVVRVKYENTDDWYFMVRKPFSGSSTFAAMRVYGGLKKKLDVNYYL